MKPHELVDGDTFRVADACNAEEMEHAWRVLEVQHFTMTLPANGVASERTVPSKTMALVSRVGGDPDEAHEMLIMPWVVLAKEG